MKSRRKWTYRAIRERNRLLLHECQKLQRTLYDSLTMPQAVVTIERDMKAGETLCARFPKKFHIR